MENSAYQDNFLHGEIPQYITEKEFLVFSSDPANKLLKDFIENRHLSNFEYYKNLILIIKGKEKLELSDIFFMLYFCMAFSKKRII